MGFKEYFMGNPSDISSSPSETPQAKEIESKPKELKGEISLPELEVEKTPKIPSVVSLEEEGKPGILEVTGRKVISVESKPKPPAKVHISIADARYELNGLIQKSDKKDFFKATEGYNQLRRELE